MPRRKSVQISSNIPSSYCREIFIPGLCLHGGYFDMLESGWKRQNHPNIMFFWSVLARCKLIQRQMPRYEELKRDQEGMVRKIADFIGYPLSEEQIQVKFLK